MKRAKHCLLIVLAVGLLAAPAARADFKLNEFDVTYTNADGSPDAQAGSHPFEMTTSLHFESFPNGQGGEEVEEAARDIIVAQVPGFVGDPHAVSQCPSSRFLTQKGRPDNFAGPDCPESSVVGYVSVKVSSPITATALYSPVYNLEPPKGSTAKLGFWTGGVPVPIELGVREAFPYNVLGGPTAISQLLEVISAKLTLWGDPASASHDALRGQCIDTETGTSRGSCPAETPERAFLTLPRACHGPLKTTYQADSWEQPGRFIEGFSETHGTSGEPLGMAGCDQLAFDPQTSAKPTTESSESASGIDFDIDVEDPGLREPQGLAHADIEKIVTSFPQGVTANPSAAEGLGACSKAEFEAERLATVSVEGCPESAKLGKIEAETPVLEGERLHGSVYLAESDDPRTAERGAENPFDSLVALYIVIRDPQRAVFVKLAAHVEPDPTTGQLVTSVEDLPPFPISHVDLQLRSGPRSPLITPPGCGEYTTDALLTPSSGGPALHSTSTFTINSGPGGASCPSGPGVVSPEFDAGTSANAAGSFAPFSAHIGRRDGEAELTHISFALPQGLTARLAGIQQCPDGAIVAARSRSGREELSSSSCPAGSAIGHVLAGAGVGSSLTYVPGTIYLAGPYLGAPFSAVVDVPAVAGPFDLGNVVIREPLRVDLFTAQASVDGTQAPLPRILRGIPIHLRDLRINVDRPGFVINSTSCEPKQISAEIAGAGPSALLTSETIDSTAVRYQAANCAALRFKPKLKIQLKGATKRTGHPALKAVVAYPQEGASANIGRAQVNLPHSEFLDQGNLNKTCTKPVLLEDRCPRTSIYGKAKAWTPLLDQPLEGPVYLVGGFGYKLPALVAELNGQIRVLLVGKVDSGKNKGIRNTFEVVPDAPVSRFVLEMKGGKKYGLLENSEPLCTVKKAKRRAIARFTAQNGMVHQFKPLIANQCGKKKRHGKRKH